MVTGRPTGERSGNGTFAAHPYSLNERPIKSFYNMLRRTQWTMSVWGQNGGRKNVEPLYGEHSFSFMMLEAGYITELLMDTAAEQQISLRECPLPDEVADSCGPEDRS